MTNKEPDYYAGNGLSPIGAFQQGLMSEEQYKGFLIGNVVLKNLIRRARPCWFYPERELLIPSPKDFSFPSGHTLSSFIAAFTLFRRDRKAGAAALILASCIAFSRLYLYVHFPSDIIGGVLLGYAVAGLTGRIFEMLSANGGTKENTRT